jgi:hypothetical protein
MTYVPLSPMVRHVWVRNSGDRGSPVPGVVVDWQHSAVHPVDTSEWLALVASAPFPEGLLISWVSADRLLPVRNPAPLDGR